MPARRRLSALVAAGILIVLAGSHAQPVAAAVTIAYPDLQLLVPEQDIQIYHPAGGVKELRFTHLVGNVGDGPLDILPVYDSTTQTAVGYQRLYGYDSSGNLTLVSQTQIADRFYWDSAHGHYHFPFAREGLYAVNSDGSVGSQVVVSPKVGFCIAEDQQVNLTLPHAPPGWVYNGNTCYDPTAVRGLSVGWGDQYDWTDPGQTIDITSVPDGTYWFRSTADPNNDFQEKDKTNNTTDLKLQITGDAVRVVSPITSIGSITSDQSYFQNGTGTITTPAFSTSAVGERLVALAASDGPLTGGQTLTVSGGGLSWTLAQRSNTQAGTAEVWSAYAATQLSGATVTSTPARGGYAQSLAVLALQGAAGIGAVGATSAPNGSPGITLTSTQAGSLVLGAGFDWDNAIYRTVDSSQTMLHQWIDFTSTATYWTQALSQPTPATGTAVQLFDTAPCCDRWNLAAVEVLPSGPPSVPAAPTGVNATPQDSAATVSWTAPANGGSPISKYTVTPYAGTTAQPSTDVTGSPPATSATIGGLTNGTTYTFTVTAANAVGSGPPSAGSNPVTPAAPTVPGAPAGISASAGNGSATLIWTAPPNGGSPITGYTVTPYIGAAPQSSTVVSGSPPATNATVTGLTNGTIYTFTVTASNAVGTGPPSVASNPVTPANVLLSIDQQPIYKDGSGTVTTSAFSTAGPGELLEALIASDGPAGSGQAVTVSGAGLTWRMAKRVNTQAGTAEIWTATASSQLSGATVTSTQTFTGYDQSLTVIAFKGASGVGNLGGASAGSGAPSVTTTTSRAGSWVFGVGNDWDRAIARTLGSNQVKEHEWVDGGTGDTYWVQATTGPTATAGTAVVLNDTAPTTDRWNFAAAEVLPAGSATVPGAPTSVSASAGNAQATVSWTPPTTNGGSAITGYTVTSSPGGVTASAGASATSALVSPLVNGTSYTFTVSATNAVATSPASAPSNAVTPRAPPGPPTNVTASAGNGQATVSWIPPTSNGGSSITGYTVTSAPGGIVAGAGASATSAVVSPLVNGTSYTFSVTATNAAGTSATSAPSNAVTPAGSPGAPTGVGATAGNGLATVSWTAPGSGGSPITRYTVTPWVGTTAQPSTDVTGSPPATSATIGGLNNGTTYTFTVTATNVVGTGPPSAASNAVTPTGPTVPGAPTGVGATAGNGLATVSWTAPGNGGSPITRYTVTPSVGTTAQPSTDVTGSPPATSTTIGGLSNGTTYTFTVTATNAVGTGPPSAASNAVTPAGPTVPGAPTNVTATAGNGSAAVSWTAAGNGGSPITKYTVTPWVGNALQPSTDVTGSPPATSVMIGGLNNGTTYTFTVTATNVVGTGPPSAASNAVTPTGPIVPGAPTGVSATAGNGSAAVRWTAPASGGTPITKYTVTPWVGAAFQPSTDVMGSPPTTSTTIVGLSNGTSYTFTVTATNAVGTGPPSAPSSAVTPQTYGQISIDQTVYRDAHGTVTTPSFNTAGPAEALVAFVASDGPASGGQTVSVAGAGLTWSLVRRTNTQAGTAEIWSAFASSKLSGVTVTSTQGKTGYDQSLTVLAFKGASGVGNAGGASAGSGAPKVSVTTSRAGSWVFGVGNDWDNPIGRTLGPNQVIEHQWVDGGVGDTYWVQAITGQTANAATVVQLNDTAPTTDRWNYAAVEVLAG